MKRKIFILLLAHLSLFINVSYSANADKFWHRESEINNWIYKNIARGVVFLLNTSNGRVCTGTLISTKSLPQVNVITNYHFLNEPETDNIKVL